MKRYEMIGSFGKAEADDMNTTGLLAEAFLVLIGKDREDGECNRMVITDNQTGKDIWVSHSFGEYVIDGDIYETLRDASEAIRYALQTIGEEE